MSAAEKKSFYDVSKVTKAAQGRWFEIFKYLGGGQLDEALEKPGKHVTCPVHGTSNKNGKGDGFRLMRDFTDSGKGYCNSCGGHSDGITLLMWLHRADFHTVLSDVAEYLRVDAEPPQSSRRATQVPQLRTVETSKTKTKVNQAQAKLAGSEPPKSRLLEGASAPTEEEMAKAIQRQEELAKVDAESAKKSEARIARVWGESKHLSLGLPPAIYKHWEKRNVLLRPERILKGDNVRYHPELPYFEENENGDMKLVAKYPAVVSAIRDYAGQIVTLHRTYLTKAGNKASVSSPRKMLSVPSGKSVTGGCAIQLGGQPVNGVLGVAEGQETAMAVMKAYSAFPTWSVVNATLLELFTPPEGTKVLLVWGDKDNSMAGQNAAEKLKARLEPKGITVHVMIPNRQIPRRAKSVDWNDIMVNEGRWGFPSWQLIRNLTGLK